MKKSHWLSQHPPQRRLKNRGQEIEIIAATRWETDSFIACSYS